MISQNSTEENDEAILNLRRNFNILQNGDIVTKRTAVKQIKEYLKNNRSSITTGTVNKIMKNFHKIIMNCFRDSVEQVREGSILILEELISRCDDLTTYLPYICEVLAERVNCHDLEGILHLPEVMRPPLSQKPCVLMKLNEPVEELRAEYNEILTTIINCSTLEEIHDFIPDICNILRALAMDPCGEVQIRACKNISTLCKTFTSLLLHFTEMLARAILLPLVNKKSKVRIAAIEALGNILYCGVWKYNTNVMEIMIGFRDPNLVPLKDFFEYSIRINYFAALINDPKTSVRDFFIRTVGDWLISLPDKFDHEGRLVPYLISGIKRKYLLAYSYIIQGLFDSDDEIKRTSYELIEEIGLNYEREKEKDLREIKQFGIDAEWTVQGKITEIPLFPPFKKRPRLGSRVFIRNHVRKFLPALYKDAKDWKFGNFLLEKSMLIPILKIENRLHASNLLLVSIIYSEDFIAQHIDKLTINLLYSLSIKEKEDKIIHDLISKVFYYLGIFCSHKSYFPLLSSALRGKIGDTSDMDLNALIALKHILRGYFDSTNNQIGISHKEEFIPLVIDELTDYDCLTNLNRQTAEVVSDIEEIILNGLLTKATHQEFEKIYRNSAYKLDQIYYCAIGHALYDLVNNLIRNEIQKPCIPAIENFHKKQKISEYHISIEKIFENLVNYNFIDQIFANLKDFYLSLTQWKMMLGFFTQQIYSRRENQQKYDENLSKLINIIKEVEWTKYSKSIDILTLNIFFIKSIFEIYVAENKTSSVSIIISTAIQIFAKIFNSLEIKKDKTKDIIRANLLQLFKNVFTNQFDFSNICKGLQNSPKDLSSFLSNISELLHKYMEFMNENENKPEYKKSLESFGNLLHQLHSVILQYPELLKLPNNNYLVPEILSMLLILIERYDFKDESQLYGIIFPIFSRLIGIIPSSNEYFQKKEQVINDYPEFLKKIISLYVDCKHAENKTRYITVLKELKKKTPANFLKEMERAEKDKNLYKIELFEKIEINSLSKKMKICGRVNHEKNVQYYSNKEYLIEKVRHYKKNKNKIQSL